MGRLYLITIIFVFSCFACAAQNHKMLLKIGDETISVNEFLKKYKKSELQGKKVDISSYFELYQNFRLKIEEDRSLKLDTIERLRTELFTYANQLILADSKKPSFETEQQLFDYLEEHESFSEIFNDLKNGVYIFELMNQNVWIPSTDSVKLASFYNSGKHNYMWPKRYSASLIKILDPEILDEVIQFAKANDINSALAKFNTGEEQKLYVENDLFEINEHPLFSKNDLNTGITEMIENEDHIEFAMIHFVFEKEPKSLNEIKGQVIADYQKLLEENWLSSLKKKYKLKVNKRLLNKLSR